MSDQPQYDVFLAYNSQDKPQVRAVAKELRQRGLNPWLDEDIIAPGRWFQDVIQQAIPDVKSAAVFIGPKGLGKWQELELRTFINQCVEADIPVIPVLLPGVDKLPTHLLFLRQLNWVCFTSGIDDVEALAKLEWGITGRKPEVKSLPANISVPSASSGFTNRQRRRLEEKLNSLQNEYDLLSKKLQSLRKSRTVETDITVKLKLDVQIEETESELEQVEQKLDQIESQLNQANCSPYL